MTKKAKLQAVDTQKHIQPTIVYTCSLGLIFQPQLCEELLPLEAWDQGKHLPVACFQCEPPLHNSNAGVSRLIRVVYVSGLGSFLPFFFALSIHYLLHTCIVLHQMLVSFHITDITKMYVQCPTPWCGGIFHAGREK